MKIIYIANIRFPTEKAHGIQIAKMCEQFSLHQNNVELIIPWRFNPIKNNPFQYYEIKKNFKIKKLPSLDLIPLNIPKIGFIVQSLTFAFSCLIYMLFQKTDLIYTRDLLIAWSLSNIKKNIFYEMHTLPFWLNKKRIKKIKRIIVITQALKNELVNKGINEDKILVVPDGVDIEKFDIKFSKEQAREKLSLPLDKKIVLYSGHLYEWKGCDILAQAAEFLPQDVLIIFVGGIEKDIKKFRDQFSSFKNILIIEHKPYSEIPYYLKAADVLVLPNSAREKISQYWTSPMKMFEYMVSQRPIVASNLPSLKEILNENNAVLVNPDNVKDLAKGIERALKTPDFSVKISTQAFQDVQQYSWQNRIKKILE